MISIASSSARAIAAAIVSLLASRRSTSASPPLPSERLLTQVKTRLVVPSDKSLAEQSVRLVLSTAASIACGGNLSVKYRRRTKSRPVLQNLSQVARMARVSVVIGSFCRSTSNSCRSYSLSWRIRSSGRAQPALARSSRQTDLLRRPAGRSPFGTARSAIGDRQSFQPAQHSICH